MKVANFMTRQVVTVRPETSVLDAARLMLDHKISGLPVVTDQNHVVGIISEHDLLRGRPGDASAGRTHWLRLMIERADLAEASGRFQARKVSEAMTPDPVTVSETAPLEEAGRLIARHDIKRLPVVRDDKLVGVISRADIVRAIIPAARKVSDATNRNKMMDARLLELERQSLLNRARTGN